MESTQHSFRVAREKKRIEEQCLRRAILNLSRALKFERLGVWMRCNAAWRARVATMRCARLKREFEFLLARCPHKRIVRFYKKFGERDTVITRIIGEFIERAGLRDLNVFEELMERYSFILMSKYYFLINREKISSRGFLFLGEQYSEFFSTSQSSFVYDESVFDAVAENANNESAQPVASTSGTVYTRRAATPLRTSSSDEDISTEDNLSLEAVLGDSQIPISESEEGHRPEGEPLSDGILKKSASLNFKKIKNKKKIPELHHRKPRRTPCAHRRSRHRPPFNHRRLSARRRSRHRPPFNHRRLSAHRRRRCRAPSNHRRRR